jgi:hypothetical protein
LFQRTWQIWRGASVLATPAPEVTPVSNAVIAAIARAEPSLVDPPAVRGGASGPESLGGKKSGAALDKAKVMLVSPQPEGKLDDEAFPGAVGLIAAVFERSPIRLSVNQGAGVDAGRTKKLIERAEGRFDVPAGKLSPAKAAIGKGPGGVEVLAVP